MGAGDHGSDFLFVTGYPMVKRPFYTHPDPARPGLLQQLRPDFPGTELVTGGQRLHRYADYLAALERKLPIEPFADYLEAFRYGMPPEGGFAIGLERLLMQLSACRTSAGRALPPRHHPPDAVTLPPSLGGEGVPQASVYSVGARSIAPLVAT